MVPSRTVQPTEKKVAVILLGRLAVLAPGLGLSRERSGRMAGVESDFAEAPGLLTGTFSAHPIQSHGILSGSKPYQSLPHERFGGV